MGPHTTLERAFLQSVLYAALFDYPLTADQLARGLIVERTDAATLRQCYARSRLLQAAIDSRDGFYFPRGRADLLAIRHRREEVSRRLLDDLATPLRLVTRMPFVRLVALSGSLAHLNAERDADLDLFVITSPKRVWSVTLTLLVLARVCGWRRRLCLNYVISERELRVSPADLFSANQIAHLQPLVDRGVFARFLDANRFVTRFYPNYTPPAAAPAGDGIGHRLLEGLLTVCGAGLFERVSRALYGWHLRRRAHTWKSREQVRLDADCLKLHTSSHRQDVLDRFDRAVMAALTRPSDAQDDGARRPSRQRRQRVRV